MRLSAVRAAIITRHETTSLDTKAGPGDKLKVLRTAREPQTVTERCAMVRLISTGRDSTNTCDAHVGVYQCAIFYAPSPDIDDRISADAERMHDPLWTLHEVEADIIEVQVGDVFVEESEGRIAARRDVRVIYRLDQL